MGSGTLFRDVVFVALLGCITILILLLPYINPPEDGLKTPPGNVLVEIRWADYAPIDVDLWVQAPGDKPVGYSSLSGRSANLLRDDLGSPISSDPAGLNYENVYVRGIPAGEYVINIHLYSNGTNEYPVPVHVSVSARPEGMRLKYVQTKTVNLTHVGQELTVFRLTLDKRGNLLSMSDIPKALRPAQ